MGRNKWEMNNTFEHTTLARTSRIGWTWDTRYLGHFDSPNGILGFGQLDNFFLRTYLRQLILACFLCLVCDMGYLFRLIYCEIIIFGDSANLSG